MLDLTLLGPAFNAEFESLPKILGCFEAVSFSEGASSSGI
jgi:hypothetical protein